MRFRQSGGEIPDCVSHYQLLKKDYVQFLGHAHDALAQLTYAFLVMAKSGHLRSYRRLRKFVYWIGLETTGNQISTPTYKEVRKCEIWGYNSGYYEH